MTSRRLIFLALLLGSGLVVGGPAVLATEAEEPGIVDDLGVEISAEERKQAREAELEAIRRTIAVSERRQATLREEIEGLEQGQASLSADLIATGRRLRSTEDDVSRIETRLDKLHSQEEGAGNPCISAATHREVLMALQRIGRTPPPRSCRGRKMPCCHPRSILAGAVLRISASGGVARR